MFWLSFSCNLDTKYDYHNLQYTTFQISFSNFSNKNHNSSILLLLTRVPNYLHRSPTSCTGPPLPAQAPHYLHRSPTTYTGLLRLVNSPHSQDVLTSLLSSSFLLGFPANCSELQLNDVLVLQFQSLTKSLPDEKF